MGYVGNNRTINTDYAASVANRMHTLGSGDFRHGAGTYTAEANFNNNYEAINSYSQGSNAGMYTVRSGDTLQSVAAHTYGDSRALLGPSSRIFNPPD